MTQNASTSRAAAPLAGVARERHVGAGVEGVLERLWHLLTSMRFSLILILILAGLTMVGTVIGQAQAETLANPDAKAEFLATASKQWYGSFVGILDPLQLFGVFRSPWFLGTAGLLVASIIACSTHRAGGLWKTATKPNVTVGPSFFEHAPYRETLTFKQSPAEVADQVRGVLRGHHFRAVLVDDGALHLYADRNRWAPLGSLAGHLSLVVILLGALVGTVFGFRDSGFMIAEGSTEAVPTMAGTTIQLLSFKDAYDPLTGAPTDYASDVVVSRDGQEVARQVVRVNDPLHVDGITFYQSFFGSAVVIKAADAQGKTLFEDGVPLGYGTQDGHSAGSFTVPGANLTAVLVGTSGTSDTLVKPGQVRVELYDATSRQPPDAAVDRPQHADRGRRGDVHVREGDQVRRPERREGPGGAARLVRLLPARGRVRPVLPLPPSPDLGTDRGAAKWRSGPLARLDRPQRHRPGERVHGPGHRYPPGVPRAGTDLEERGDG